MTSRERVRKAINFEKPDRVPIDYSANPGIDRRLKEHFGLRPEDTHGLRQVLGVDFAGVSAPYSGPQLHPDLPDRQRKLMKLLARLFSEIDLNDNGSMEWAEFCNYIIHNSNSSGKNDNNSYRLRFYQPSRMNLDLRDFKENISFFTHLPFVNWQRPWSWTRGKKKEIESN